ncbi:MAG: hypothetical protein AAFX54_00885 [Pseudomonadota bacterium]
MKSPLGYESVLAMDQECDDPMRRSPMAVDASAFGETFYVERRRLGLSSMDDSAGRIGSECAHATGQRE